MIPASRRLDTAVVVIPAHNERDGLPGCLRSVVTAAAGLPVPVSVIVVLDSCEDDSAALAGRYGADVHFVSIEAGNVGAARAAGFRYARRLYDDPARTWFATTDADTAVDPGWLLRQTATDADAVLGVVRVADWHSYADQVAQRYLADYHSADCPDGGEEHDHIHGANMGFRADAYWRVGGFAAQRTGEDVDLVERMQRAGLRVHRDAHLSVSTSARRIGRAPGGFADHLAQVSRRVTDAVTGEAS